MGPMLAAGCFLERIRSYCSGRAFESVPVLRCTLKGSLAFTGKGHNTDRAVALGLHGYAPDSLLARDLDALVEDIWRRRSISPEGQTDIAFSPADDIVFDRGQALPEHPNGMIFELLDLSGKVLLAETFFSIGGGFVSTRDEIKQLVAPLRTTSGVSCRYGFESADAMLEMAVGSGLSIADMKRVNEGQHLTDAKLDRGLDAIWQAMRHCVEQGLRAKGLLPGGLNLARRAADLHEQLLQHPDSTTINDCLCAYAMAVNEENAAGNMVVTAPTNGAAGVIPAVLYYLSMHRGGTAAQVREFLLTASAIGGIIKHRSSISGAEVGCQGEVGSAAAMAAAGLCAVLGGTPHQVENAAEIALEHHLGMTCDPVNGLVQVPCIERNAFGAIKAYTAASLAMMGTGKHFMSLDNCIAAMRQTGLDMSEKYKETSLGGLAVSITEC
jgi:L-serine dehydratase